MKRWLQIISKCLILFLVIQIIYLNNFLYVYADNSLSINGNKESIEIDESEEVKNDIIQEGNDVIDYDNYEDNDEISADSEFEGIEESNDVSKDEDIYDDSQVDNFEETTEKLLENHDNPKELASDSIDLEEHIITSIPEDIDRNGIINEDDLDKLSSKYNILKGQAGYEERYDLNNDGIIDIYDLTMVSNKIGTKPIVKGKVTADVLNVRSGPGTEHTIIGTVYEGTIVEILDDSNPSWYNILYSGGTGYVSSQYISKYIDYDDGGILPNSKVIVIDPGHGGADSGSVGPGGSKEEDITLKVGLKVRDMLKGYGYSVIMTRDGDYALGEDTRTDLINRAQIANNNNADIFISIHINSASGIPSATGTETYYHTSNTLNGESKLLANNIQSNLVKYLGLYNRGVKQEDFSVLRNTKMPAVLAELGFINNPNEEKKLITDEFQTKAAKGIVDGVLNYLK